MPNVSIRYCWTEAQIRVLKYSCIYIIYKDIFCVLKWRFVVYSLWCLDVILSVKWWCRDLPYIFLASVITSCSRTFFSTTNNSVFFSLVSLMYILNKKKITQIYSAFLTFCCIFNFFFSPLASFTCDQIFFVLEITFLCIDSNVVYGSWSLLNYIKLLNMHQEGI